MDNDFPFFSKIGAGWQIAEIRGKYWEVNRIILETD